MTPRQYRDALERLGLTHEEITRILGISRRTSYNWAAGDAPMPLSAVYVLRYWLHTGISPELLPQEMPAPV